MSLLYTLTNSVLIAYQLPAERDRQTGSKRANALIAACHMIGLAGVLVNKALMNSFNCLHEFPAKHPELHTNAHIIQITTQGCDVFCPI